MLGWALRGSVAGLVIGAPAALIMVVFVVGFLFPLKILVAFIQTFIFCKLAMLYIAAAVEEAEHH
jgi:F0F1-type ATP synthase membrane subunit a